MYHGPDGRVLYSLQAKHHESILETTGQRLTGLVENGQLSPYQTEPFVAVDFGTCDGVLGLKLFELITSDIRKRWPNLALVVIINGNAGNDFNKLATSIAESNLEKQDGVSFFLNNHDMYKRCLPAESVDVAICSLAVHFINKPIGPIDLQEEISSNCKRIQSLETEAFKKQAAQDWVAFLTERWNELKKGGWLLVNVPVKSPGEQFLPIQMLSDEWRNLYKERQISKEEFHSAIVPEYFRSMQEVEDPFEQGVFEKKLQLMSVRTTTLRPFHLHPKVTHGLNEYADSVVTNMQSWTRTFLAKALIDRPMDDKNRFLDLLYGNMKLILLSEPLKSSEFTLAEVVVKKI